MAYARGLNIDVNSGQFLPVEPTHSGKDAKRAAIQALEQGAIEPNLEAIGTKSGTAMPKPIALKTE